MAYDDINSYPKKVRFYPKTPYVYFNTINPEIFNNAAKEFSRNLSFSRDTRSIDDAFSFLTQVIQSERGKEEAFLQYLKDKTQTKFDIKLPAIDSDWRPFVLEIQEMLDFGNVGRIDLEQEMMRLDKNKTNLENARASKDTIDYVRGVTDTIGKVSTQLESLLNSFKKTMDRSTNSYKFISVIIERYKNVLLEVDSNKKLKLNQKELVAVLEAISTEFIHLYLDSPDFVTEIVKDNEVKRQRNLSIEKMNKFLDENKEIDDSIINMITRIKQLPKTRESLVSSLNLNGGQKNKYYDMSPVLHGGELIDDTDAIVKQLWDKLSQFQIPESAIKIIHQESAFAEIESMVKFAVTGALNIHNTGSQQAKPDNIIGYLAVDPKQMLPSENKNIQILINKINSIQSKIAQVARGVKQTNTLQYYQQQKQVWDKLTKEINAILKELKDDYQILSSCFVIEDSTKNYTALYSSMEGGELETGPHGGSLGPNLSDQINKLEALTQTGGITMIDKDWLIAAIINSGPNMAAAPQKASLEDYLAMFAAILLFDSQLNIAEEAMKRATNKMPSSSVHQIHLFSVNNGYYPLSYVLKLTYDHLEKGLGNIQKEVMDSRQGVQTEITGYISKPVQENNSQENWDLTAKTALKSTKIKMRFLVHLMDTIHDLLQFP